MLYTFLMDTVCYGIGCWGLRYQGTVFQSLGCKIQPEEKAIKKHMIIALFTVTKTWKQPKCPSTDEWIKMMWYIYTAQYCSAIKKNEIMPFAGTWMDLEIIILSEVSQTEKDKHHMISFICGT